MESFDLDRQEGLAELLYTVWAAPIEPDYDDLPLSLKTKWERVARFVSNRELAVLSIDARRRFKMRLVERIAKKGKIDADHGE